jgi:L-2-hydroxyglutarate oxidase LhgO
VATDNKQLEELESIRAKAHANGVTDVDFISRDQALAWEPELRCVAALHSPSTGIIDSHALMLAYLGDAQTRGAMLALKSTLRKVSLVPDGFELHVGGSDPIKTKILVNSAGLRAPSVAGSIDGFEKKFIPRELYAKGNYYSLARKSPFSRLIYPVPEPGGLGVHVTLDLAGQARFGPDISWIDGVDYSFDHSRAPLFYEAIRSYYPGLQDGRLTPGYTGIRPKISGPKDPAADFVIQGPKDHGVAGLVSLYGIESPGLTASLAIAERVRDLLVPETGSM